MNNSVKMDSQSVLSAKVRLLQIDSVTLGVPEEQVAAIAEWSEPSPLPFAPESVLGIVCIDGRMMTVLDLGALLNPTAAAQRAARRHIIALRGDEQLALAVDAIEDLIQVTPNEFAKAGKVHFLLGTATHQGAQVHLVDINQLFASVIQGRERRQRRTS
jgi:purine-binding chemotaxis protein CheW